ncbi:MAG: TolC family protein [Parvularculaceae bacterium]|nr:TolC family protein [Parvularculaceae bacterium]
MLKKILFASAASLALAGCGSMPGLGGEAPDLSRSLPKGPDAWAMAQESVGDVQVGWIAAFNDPVLTKLVDEAQANNRDLQAAAANVDRSRAIARQAGAALSPQVSLVAGGSETANVESGQSLNNYNAGVQVAWEADLWGRVRSGRNAAAAGAEAAEADYRFAQYSVAAGVARAYFVTIEAGLQEKIAQDTVTALEETVRIVNVQYENGLASSQDLALVRSDLATANDVLSTTSGAKRDATRALEVLLGRYPGAELGLRTSLPEAPVEPAAGVPSEVLERRPDLIAAERNVAAAFNNTKAAKAARLPSLSLTSTLGGASNSLSDVLDPTNVAWTAAGNLLAPLIDGGLRRSQVEVANAEQQAAVAAYAQAALNAFSDVESSLDQGQVLKARLASLTEAADEAAEAYRIARIRYTEGETSLIDTLNIQQRLFSAQSNLTTVQRLMLDQRINLNLALGGDWQ